MCTLEQRGRVFVLTLTGDGEHRLGHPLIASIRSALVDPTSSPTLDPGRGTRHRPRFRLLWSAQANGAGVGAALVTVAEGRFFPNVLGGHLPRADRGARRRVPRHRQGPPGAPHAHRRRRHGPRLRGGLLPRALPRAHDYRIMRADRGVLYMSEVDIGLPLPPYFMALVRAKITAAQALRDVVLHGKKIRAPEAKEMGIVDVVCPGAPEALKLAEQLAARKWDGAVYASIRISMFPDACRSVGIVEESDVEKARNFASKL
ncbi:unnamed protein product [Alopecurus aequalis]